MDGDVAIVAIGRLPWPGYEYYGSNDDDEAPGFSIGGCRRHMLVAEDGEREAGAIASSFLSPSTATLVC